MLYSILKPIIRLSLLVFFRRIDILGEENVPNTGPVIFVANHPSALMDPLTVATTLKRKINFLAGAEWFGKGLKARFFKKQLNMIPVHRPWLAKTKVVSNEDMFKECYKSLAEGKCVIIFPEASSETVSKIRELKTGAVRIKAGFEEYTNGKMTVPIVPVGLSYSNAHKFQSRVVVKIGKAISFNKVNEDQDLAEVYRAQTTQMQDALKDSIIHIDNNKNEGLVKKVSRLFIDTHRENRGISFKERQDNFKFDQNVAHAVDYFEKTDQDGYHAMMKRIDSYFETIKTIGISDDLIGGSSRSKLSVPKLVFIILGSLIAIPSLVLFFIPFQLTKIIFKNKLNSTIKNDAEVGMLDNAFTGTLMFSIGMVIFILWTFIVAGIVALTTDGWIPALVALIVMYPMMRFSMTYAKVAFRLRHQLKGNNLKMKHKLEIDSLVKEREQIIDDLKEYQKVFDINKELVLD